MIGWTSLYITLFLSHVSGSQLLRDDVWLKLSQLSYSIVFLLFFLLYFPFNQEADLPQQIFVLGFTALEDHFTHFGLDKTARWLKTPTAMRGLVVQSQSPQGPHQSRKGKNHSTQDLPAERLGLTHINQVGIYWGEGDLIPGNE